MAKWMADPVAHYTGASDVLAGYVGVYKGRYSGTERTIEVTLSGGQLIARIIGATAVDGGEFRPLIPRSQTRFEGLESAISSSSTTRV